jgi:hypothetical protein
MGANTDEPLEQAITALDELIGLVRERGLSQSELFLDMARLQLRLELNGITDDEFSAFCDALERGELASGSHDRTRTGHARPRRNGELRLMRRAWRHPQDALAPRGGRAGR